MEIIVKKDDVLDGTKYLENEDFPNPLHPAMTNNFGLCIIELRCYFRGFIRTT